MIHTVWPYLAVMLLVAGLFPAMERRFGWRVFNVLPPIVLTYLLVTALAVVGLWQINDEIRATQSMLVGHMVPALLFLLMINCDLRAIFALGPRVLGVFACTSVSLFIAFIATYLLYKRWLPGDAWHPLAALSGSWVGGTANMIAVKQGIGMSDQHLAMSLLTDALCYSMWVVVLFAVARLAPAFNRFTRARSSGDLQVAEAKTTGPTTPDAVLLWLGMALLASALAAWVADYLPASGMVSPATWTILLATGAGLVVAHTPLARFPGAGTISSAMLISVVAVLASQSNFHGIGAAPLYLLCGVTIIALHAVLLVGFARLFHFDLYLCGISSLAHIGGVAATPILAASYSRALVPVGILLALLGYILGTGFGLLVASVMSALAGP
ncbi:MAG: DUF819 domain-containing protein [Frateuria sp.]|uniref:DUF819 family protein n=1 Tax=Frateuria sp. TaxID=2211372 RepID=UPI0017D126AB|nr:DUF819 family protein [Frateuria sp.]NUO74123.1 DUF819 domain-containing protein [Frateuria sp.]NUR22340.1 DUF819 domain-containing protein [Frateuria sp.]